MFKIPSYLNRLFIIILLLLPHLPAHPTFENQKKPTYDLEAYLGLGVIGGTFLAEAGAVALFYKTYQNFYPNYKVNQRWNPLVVAGCASLCNIGVLILAFSYYLQKWGVQSTEKWNNRTDEEVCNDAYNTWTITERNFSKIQNIAKTYLEDNEISLPQKNSIITTLAKLNQAGLIHLIKSLSHTYKVLTAHETALKERSNFHNPTITDWHGCIKQIQKTKDALYQIHNLIIESAQYQSELEKAKCKIEGITIENTDLIRD